MHFIISEWICNFRCKVKTTLALWVEIASIGIRPNLFGHAIRTYMPFQEHTRITRWEVSRIRVLDHWYALCDRAPHITDISACWQCYFHDLAVGVCLACA